MTGVNIKNVVKKYKEGDTEIIALNNVSMSVEPGEFVAIIGPSGSGKSTLLTIAGALLKATSGEVIVNGTNISNLSDKELSNFRLNKVGFILQTSNLLPYLNVLEQVELVKKMTGSLTKEDKDFAISILKDLGLGEKLKKMPNELSGGERQRVAIARAFMNNPDVILADEPTASLDSNRAFEVVQLISSEVKKLNKAAIMVTHDERMLQYCDKVFRMSDGNLVQENK